MTIPLVKQVLTLHGAFECSICRHRYRSREAAQNCLERCFFASLAKAEPVLCQASRKGSVFVCNWCLRRYANEDKAQQCAQICQDQQVEKFRRELNSFRYDWPVKKPFPTGRVSAPICHPLARKPPFFGLKSVAEPRADVAIEVPLSNLKPKPAEELVQSASAEELAVAGVEFISEHTEFSGVELVTDTLSEPGQLGEKQRQFLKTGRPPVSKLGVKYRCNLCRLSFYEAKEAERCFHAHT